MSLRRLINRGIRPFGVEITRINAFVPQEVALSPTLTRAVELTAKGETAPDNPLWQRFQANSTGDLHKWHHYFGIYDQWFSQFRMRPDFRMLEIGVSRGGSLRLWRDYFHPDATIVGLDIAETCRTHAAPDRKIFVEIGDQADPSFLARVVEMHGPFDVVLDDGGHTTAQQIASFNALYGDALNDGGVYLVEDTHSNYWADSRNTPESFVDLAKSLVDRLHEPYFDHWSETDFRIGHPDRVRSLSVSAFYASARSISFYDSVIVFEKRWHPMPVVEIR